MYDDITEVLVELGNMPNDLSLANICTIKKFVILLYERTTDIVNINELWKHLFVKGRTMENIPLTKAALEQHIKRALYQASYCW